MIASSRRSCRGGCFDGEGAAVADQGPNQVNQAAGERDQSLDMPLSFGSLALVERREGLFSRFIADSAAR
jgi:hypothetical protein